MNDNSKNKLIKAAFEKLLTTGYSSRYGAVQTLLKLYEIPCDPSSLRRIFRLICPTEEEEAGGPANVENLKKAENLLRIRLKEQEDGLDYERLNQEELDRYLIDTATEGWDFESIHKLLDHGANLLAENSEITYSAFQYMIPIHDVSLLKRVLLKGLDWHLPCYAQRVPAFSAQGSAMSGYPWSERSKKEVEGLFKKVVDKATDINALDGRGSALIHEVWKPSFARILISTGANIEIRNREGRTPIQLMAHNTNEDMVQLYVDAGADIHVCDNDGNTPLIIAVKRGSVFGPGHYKAASILFRAGADPTAANSVGETAISLAKASGHEDIRTILGITANDNEVKEQKRTAKKLREEILLKMKSGREMTVEGNREYWITLQWVDGVFIYKHGDTMLGDKVLGSQKMTEKEALETFESRESWREESEIEKLKIVLERVS